MRIKKTRTNNEYIRAGGVLVRNFSKSNISPIGLSHMFESQDYSVVLANEEINKKYLKISDESFSFPKMVIVSDGYDFENRHRIIEKFPPDVCVFAINGALRKWKIAKSRSINAYVANNPHKNSLADLPNSYFPTCIASIRANKDFLKRYRGNIYVYSPTPERFFGYESKEEWFVDDYRNPVCACVNLAYHFNVKKLMLMCCDESFNAKREAAVQLKNNLWTYPQHIRSEAIIDSNFYWLTHEEDNPVEVANYSSGGEYENATYITNEEEALGFFRDQEEPANG